MKSLTVWVLQTGEPLHSDDGQPRPMRAMNLANALVDKGHNVILWSSGFYHQEKRHRSSVFEKIHINDRLEIRLIPSPGYKRNVSISRLIDHFVLALNLKKQLDYEELLPDVAFVGYPPIESAFVMTRWLKKKCIPSVLDVKDQWPSVLVQSMPKLIQPIARVLLSLYYFSAKKTMRDSTGICAMSEGFIDWSLGFSNRVRSHLDIVSPLTSPKDLLTNLESDDALSWWSERGVSKNSSYRIMFVGSFSRAFDFDIIFDAANDLLEKGMNCEFVLCGDGELTSILQEKANICENVKIVEWIDRPKIVALSEISSAFIAPYKNSPDFVMSIPNKVIDALKLGLPLLSPLEGEVEALINLENVGIKYSEKEGHTLFDGIAQLIKNPQKQDQLSYNATNVFDKKYSFDHVYGSLVNHIESISEC